MEKDWLFATDEYICDLRTVAVLVKDNKTNLGSTTSNLVMILFPSYFLIKLDLGKSLHIIPRFLCVLGIFTIGFFIYSETYKVIFP